LDVNWDENGPPLVQTRKNISGKRKSQNTVGLRLRGDKHDVKKSGVIGPREPSQERRKGHLFGTKSSEKISKKGVKWVMRGKTR